MQIKTTLRYHCIPMRMAITKIFFKWKIISVGNDVENSEHTTGGEAKLLQLLLKMS